MVVAAVVVVQSVVVVVVIVVVVVVVVNMVLVDVVATALTPVVEFVSVSMRSRDVTVTSASTLSWLVLMCLCEDRLVEVVTVCAFTASTRLRVAHHAQVSPNTTDPLRPPNTHTHPETTTLVPSPSGCGRGGGMLELIPWLEMSQWPHGVPLGVGGVGELDDVYIDADFVNTTFINVKTTRGTVPRAC